MSHPKRLLIGGVFVALSAALLWPTFSQQRTATAIAAPANASARQTALPTTPVVVPKGRQVATFGAGCFWSMEAVYKQLKGVDSAVPGYAGGNVVNPGYEKVGTGKTGHAESLRIVFDPTVISYAELLDVMMTVHDPTTLNRQGADEGTQYRSAIFFHNEAQRVAANEAIRKLNAARVYKDKIVTQVVPFANFYTAEKYHFDYYNQHSDEPYCKGVIAPKIAKFKAKYKSKLKSSS